MNQAEFDREYEFVVQTIDEKLERLSRKLSIVKHVLALYRYMVDPEVHWAKKVLVASALVYFILPADAIPDFTPIIGYIDDAAFIAAVIKTLGKDFLKYYSEENTRTA